MPYVVGDNDMLEITWEVVDCALTKVKPKKLPGSDNLSINLFKGGKSHIKRVTRVNI